MSRKSSYKLLIKGLVLPASIGIYEHEKNKEQKIKIDVTMEMRSKPSSDEIDSVISYDDIIANIHKLLNSGHFNLVETLVEKIGNLCLEENNVKKAQEILHHRARCNGLASTGNYKEVLNAQLA